MKTLLLSTILSICTLAAFGQTFYVEPTEKGFEETVSQILEYNSIKTTKVKEEANFVISHYFQKVKSINVGSYEAYIKVVDKSGKEVFTTSKKKKQANAYNGYNAVPAILDILTKKELVPEIKKGLI